MSACSGPGCTHPDHAHGVTPKGGTTTFRLEVELLPTGQADLNAVPVSKGVRSFVVARCRSESIAETLRRALADRPQIVCICGSTRFADRMNAEAERLTLDGKIVVRPEVVAYSRERDQQFVAPEVKARLDALHLRKIDLADRVFVVNVGGYVGDSTRREIAYAAGLGKPVDFLEPMQAPAEAVAP